MPVDEIVVVHAEKHDLPLVPIMDGKQGRKASWPRAGVCAHVHRRTGEEALAKLGRATDDTG
jgi:hypothetical protein